MAQDQIDIATPQDQIDKEIAALPSQEKAAQELETLSGVSAQEIQERIDRKRSESITAEIDPRIDPNSPEFDEEAYKEAARIAAEAMNAAIVKNQEKNSNPAEQTAADILESAEELRQTATISLHFFTQQGHAAAQAIGQALKDADAAIPKYSPEFVEAVADLDPYLRIELENAAILYPKFRQYTIWDVYDQGFDESGTPKPDSDFAAIIRLAQLRKKSYETAEVYTESVAVLQSHIEQLENNPTRKITARPTEKVDFPLDKPNREIWELITGAKYNDQLQLATVTIDTSKGKKKRETGIIYGISFDKLEEAAPNMKITKQLTQYDKRVYIATAALYNAGNEITTATQIYRAMGNTGRPKAADLKKINDSLTKMGAARVYINNTHEAKTYSRYPLFKYDANLLPFERISAIVNGQTTETAIHFFREPPLMTFARERKQITTFSIRLLESPVNKTDANLAIDDFLLERISHIKKGKANPKILYDTLYTKCKITTTKQKQRAPKTIKRYLDHYKQCGFIHDYTEESDGIYIYVSKAAAKADKKKKS